MTIKEIMKERNMSRYKLSKESGIPYSTIDDIYKGKTKIGKCSAETIYKMSIPLNVTMEELVAPYYEKRIDFELYKSNVCHELKQLGDIEFIVITLKKDSIRKYYKKKWYPECLYLLAMVDYISRRNRVPLCTDYNDLRNCKLQKIIYPTGILIEAQVKNDESIKKRAYDDSIPEFKRFNIVENEVYNVV